MALARQAARTGMSLFAPLDEVLFRTMAGYQFLMT